MEKMAFALEEATRGVRDRGSLVRPYVGGHQLISYEGGRAARSSTRFLIIVIGLLILFVVANTLRFPRFSPPASRFLTTVVMMEGGGGGSRSRWRACSRC